MDKKELLKKNENAEIISNPIIAGELQKIIDNKLESIKSVSEKIYKLDPRNIIFVGSGNSWSSMYSGKYLLNKYSNIQSELFFGPELITINPKYIDDNTVAILASYSGTTEDTIDAAKYLKDKGAKTISITNKSDSLVATATDMNICYESKSLYVSALFELYFLIIYLLELRGEFKDFSKFFNEIKVMPSKLETVVDKSRNSAKELAEKLESSEMFYLSADGPLYGLGYQTALTIFTEYLRMDAAIINGCEFQHGTLEIVGNGKPVIGFLLGNDSSRVYTERTMNFCNKYGAKTFSFDIKDYGIDIDPILSPFFVFPKINWFILYMSVVRNIDLDEYIYMHMVDYY